jgi:hypothetical protein
MPASLDLFARIMLDAPRSGDSTPRFRHVLPAFAAPVDEQPRVEDSAARRVNLARESLDLTAGTVMPRA